MTAPDPRLGEIEARLARRDAMIEDGSYKSIRTRCDDPESHYTHSPHPKQVATEVSLHNSYVSHLEALADSIPYLLTELQKRDEVIARVEALADELAAEAIASRNVERKIRKGPPSTLSFVHAQHATIAHNHANRIRAAVTAAKGDGA